jgi:hypothetical protein
MGRFDHAGNSYDGPYGVPDGIDFLDNQSFIFNTCVANFNIAPVVSSLTACDTIVMCEGDSTTIDVSFLAPENGQQTVPSVQLGNLQDATITQLDSGAVANAQVVVYATSNNTGFHTIRFLGTDNGTPPKTTTTPVTIHVIGRPTASLVAIPDTGTSVYFDNRSTNYQIAFIDFGDGSSGYCYFDTLHYYAFSGTYNVMMVVYSLEGCFTDTVYQTVTISSSTGVPSVTVSPYYNLVPNPSKGIVRLFGQDNQAIRLRLTDATGRLVFDRKNLFSDQEVDLRELQTGVYFFSLLSDKEEILRTGKLVIE